MLTAQQAAAKGAAHQKFDSSSVATAQESEAPTERLPHFTPGIAGIGVVGDALRVYVLEDRAPDVEIPNEIEGLRTERVFTKGFRAPPLEERREHAPVRQGALSPVPCGVSIGHHDITAGTLGCLVDIPGARCILSNNHILAKTNVGQLGDVIMQPGPKDATATSPARRIASLTDYEPLRFDGSVNHIDAAIAAVDDAVNVDPNIMAVGRHVNPPVAVLPEHSVAKHGRTTGLTFGTVVDISFDGVVDFEGRTAYFEDQIVIVGDNGPFSAGGDSGSLILDSPGSHPIGLLFAGDYHFTLANPIHSVLNRFGATVVTT